MYNVMCSDVMAAQNWLKRANDTLTMVFGSTLLCVHVFVDVLESPPTTTTLVMHNQRLFHLQ